MNAVTFLGAVRLYWRLFAAVLGACVLGAVAWALLTPRAYVSTTQLMVVTSGSTTATSYENDQVVWGRVNSYVELLTSEVVNQRVVDKLGLSESARELAANVGATIVPPKTTVIDVAVTDTSPDRARLLAGTLASEFVAYSDALEAPTGVDGQKVHTVVIDSANMPQRKLPGPVTFGIPGALTGLVLGGAAVWIRYRTDPIIRDAGGAEMVSGLPTIGTVESMHGPEREELDEYRRLRMRLRSPAVPTGESESDGRVWVVTCSDGEVDTIEFSSNLGRALAMGGDSVLVIEANPATSGATDSPGLFDVLSGSASADQVTRRGVDGFRDVMSAGGGGDGLDDLLAATSTRRLVGSLKTSYDHIVIDVAPVLSTQAATILGELADGVLLVVVAGATRRREFSGAVDGLRMAGVPLVGTVMWASVRGPAFDSATESADDAVLVRSREGA